MEPIPAEQLLDMSLPDLFALHTKLDEEIADIRKVQAQIDGLIGRKEKASKTPGDPALTQGVTHG